MRISTRFQINKSDSIRQQMRTSLKRVGTFTIIESNENVTKLSKEQKNYLIKKH